MGGAVADAREVAPAAEAFFVGGAGDPGGGRGAGGGFPEEEVAEDEVFGGVCDVRGGYGGGAVSGDFQDGGGFEVASDEFFLAGFIDFQHEEVAELLEFADLRGGGGGGEVRIGHGEVVLVDTVLVPGEFPGFVGGEGKDRRQ